MEELDAGLKPKTRRKIEQKLEEGWKFDAESWAKSVERHKKYDMKQIFGQFDADGDGKLDLYEISRAFRALGLKKRDGTKAELDAMKRKLSQSESALVAEPSSARRSSSVSETTTSVYALSSTEQPSKICMHSLSIDGGKAHG